MVRGRRGGGRGGGGGGGGGSFKRRENRGFKDFDTDKYRDRSGGRDGDRDQRSGVQI